MKKPTSKLNREWHLANPMPKNPTLEQRMAWHIEHAKNCKCRAMPVKLKEQVKMFTAKRVKSVFD